MEIVLREKGRAVFSISVPSEIAEYLKRKENVSGYMLNLIKDDMKRMKAFWNNDPKLTEETKQDMNKAWSERKRLMDKYGSTFARYEELVYNNKINYPYNEISEKELKEYFLLLEAIDKDFGGFLPSLKYWERVSVERGWE